MAEIWCGVNKKTEGRRKKMEMRRFKFLNGSAVESVMIRDGADRPESTGESDEIRATTSKCKSSCSSSASADDDSSSVVDKMSGRLVPYLDRSPKFGVTSVIGRRTEMEDAVAVHPSFCREDIHYFGIYDGHGCSHVAISCKNRMHEFVKEESERGGEVQCASWAWKDAMERSFFRMDQEAIGTCDGSSRNSSCRCDLQMPDCDAVGSTAVVSIVTPDKIIVANCGDSRAVLCRAGKPVPLSNDHKPDRPDELQRIQDAGGRVIFWDGPRVLGVLAMSRAIGDNYLKPYVSSEPEVTVTARTEKDECLILASDGLWDVVSNDTACEIARMCLRGESPLPLLPTQTSRTSNACGTEGSDPACSDAALLLTKLALARNSTDNVSVIIVDLRRGTYNSFQRCLPNGVVPS